MPDATTGFKQTLSRSPTGDLPLKMAVQRSGRLTQDTLDLLHAIGLQFESYGQRLFSHCRNFPLSILYGRDDDIPGYIGLGTVDLGIVGRNLLHEENVVVEELAPLGFGYCELVVATLRDAPFTRPEQLLDARIATSYPESARRYFSGAWRPSGDHHHQWLGRSGSVPRSGGCDRRADCYWFDTAPERPAAHRDDSRVGGSACRPSRRHGGPGQAREYRPPDDADRRRSGGKALQVPDDECTGSRVARHPGRSCRG